MTQLAGNGSLSDTFHVHAGGPAGWDSRPCKNVLPAVSINKLMHHAPRTLQDGSDKEH